MSALQLLLEAMRSLLSHPLRSALAMLGIVIGIASVVLMLGVGDAVRHFVSRELAVLGSHQLIVQAGAANGGEAPPLTLDDAASLEGLPGVSRAAPLRQASALVHHGGRDALAVQRQVQGTTAAMFELRHWVLDEGVAFTEDDARAAQRVAVVGQRVALAMGGMPADTLGRTLRVGGTPFVVVGVLAGQGRMMDGTDLGDLVVVPIHALPLVMPTPRAVHGLYVQASGAERVPQAEQAIARTLRERRSVGPQSGRPVGDDGQPLDNFRIVNLAQIAKSGGDIATALSLALGFIGAVALGVGGIGIMNIMLVSVNERVREIGVRLALGARPAEVRGQFLLEAVVLCLAGAGAGVALAALVFWALRTAGGFELSLSLSHLSAAIAFASAVGLFFGWMPARRAAALNPVECLRAD